MTSRLTQGLSTEMVSQLQRKSANDGRGGPVENPLGSLQRMVGNRAVSALLARNGPTVSRDAAAEAQADLLADAAVEQMGPSSAAPPLIGGALSPALRTALGAVASGLGELGRVPVHIGPQAEASADAIGARAFTSQGGIWVGRGELGQGVDSTHLIAHEAAHAGLHTAANPSGLVHAKLRGTRAAAEQMGGGSTTTGLRKLVGWKTNWDRILDGLGAYEAMEAKLLTGHSTPRLLAGARPKLLATLQKIEVALLAWQRANDEKGETETTEKSHQETIKQGFGSMEKDERTKFARRQTVAMLLPRVRTEAADIESGRWHQTLGLSDSELQSTGREESGQVNKVMELNYGTESGPFSGFFKEDKGFVQATQVAGHDAKSGIRQVDPNFGARAMAMYRLDQLLGAGVTARVEWAVHEVEDKMGGPKVRKLGTVLESAKGTRAIDTQFAVNQEGSMDSPSMDDPTLQRCLNKLQVLDAIAGQLDRHPGNYFIQHENGKVTGVTGIDLDMSFGRDLHSPDEDLGAFNYRGMPKEIDEEFGRRILAVSEEQLRAALTGLLPEPEVQATVDRFRIVKAKIEQAQEAGLLRTDWDAKTAMEARGNTVELMKPFGKSSGYVADVAKVGVENAAEQARLAAERELDSLRDELPGLTLHTYKKFLTTKSRFGSRTALVEDLLIPLMAGGQLTGSDADAAAVALIDAATGSSPERDKFEVAIQEGENEDAVSAMLKEHVQAIWPNVSERYTSPLVRT